jgi:hypothetical protein
MVGLAKTKESHNNINDRKNTLLACLVRAPTYGTTIASYLPLFLGKLYDTLVILEPMIQQEKVPKG